MHHLRLLNSASHVEVNECITYYAHMIEHVSYYGALIKQLVICCIRTMISSLPYNHFYPNCKVMLYATIEWYCVIDCDV